jgi:hypothetical protein
VIVQSNTGKLFNVDADTGVTDEIDLGGGSVPAGDGILLDGGRRLWVVQNAFNQVALVDLNSGLTAGEIVATRGADDGTRLRDPNHRCRARESPPGGQRSLQRGSRAHSRNRVLGDAARQVRGLRPIGGRRRRCSPKVIGPSWRWCGPV